MKTSHVRIGSLSLIVLGAAGGVLLSGCDAKTPAPTAVAQAQQKYDAVKLLEGLVSDNDGPVKSGVVKALTEKGAVIASTELNDKSKYALDVPAGTVLPIVIAYYPTAEAGDDQRMITVAVHAAVSKYDINPASTRIAEQAKALGGYTHKNLVRAAESSGIVPANNKTTAGFRGDPTTQYGGWH